ncbi:MAG: hypothetical protein ACP5XB_05630 [Isosphaeraceae bacterium]
MTRNKASAGGMAPRHIRSAYAMAEAVLAFAILGVALAGLAPFVVTQLRLIHKLETRFQGTVTVTIDGKAKSFLPNQASPAQTYYCVPWKNPWMQILYGRAAILSNSSTNASDDYTTTYTGHPPQPSKTNTLTIYSSPPYNPSFTYTDMTSDPQSIMVYVDVEPSS